MNTHRDEISFDNYGLQYETQSCPSSINAVQALRTSTTRIIYVVIRILEPYRRLQIF